MAKTKSTLHDIPQLDANFWKITLGQLIVVIRERVQSKHENHRGAKFKAYSKKYAELKGSGDSESLGLKGVSISSTSTTPDMTLTGQMMHNLKTRGVNKTGGRIGWDGVAGEKITQLAKRKNYTVVGMSGNPLTKTENKFVLKAVDKKIGRNIKKETKRPIIIKVGKK